MGLEIVLFIMAILFGIVIYWRESKGNKIYRFVNKIFNSEELQMKSSNKKGFVYEQPFLLRLVYVSVFFLLLLISFQFIVPIQVSTISIFVSMIAGTLIGTYISNIVFKSSEIIEEQTENLEEIVEDTIEKGKDFIEDIKEDVKDIGSSKKIDTTSTKEIEKAPEKSARERLKEKGLL